MWREAGFEIVGQAVTQRSAVRYVQSSSVDLVVCRDGSPDMDAVQLAKTLAVLQEPPVVIILSPDKDAEKMRECFLSGVLDYITEPASDLKLRDALERAANHIKSSDACSEYRLTVTEYFAEIEGSVKNTAFLKMLEELISANEGKVVTVQSAAAYFGFNKDYFGRLFRQNTGMTFGEFYKRFRIMYAQKLLATGRYKVHEVGEMLGFATADYFTAEFRRRTGKRPSEIRSSGK